MNAIDLLTRLEAEGVSVSLNLKVDADVKPSDETWNLITENRYALLAHLRDSDQPTPLLNKGVGEKPSDNKGYRLPPILLHNLMSWVAKYHELRLEHPSGIILNAQPHHVVEASEAYPWGITYDPERYLLMSWGDVPTYALMGKRDLETGELLIAEQVAA
jgi:hypothetical protein